jgi:hypothetical protein
MLSQGCRGLGGELLDHHAALEHELGWPAPVGTGHQGAGVPQALPVTPDGAWRDVKPIGNRRGCGSIRNGMHDALAKIAAERCWHADLLSPSSIAPVYRLGKRSKLPMCGTIRKSTIER